MATVDNVLGREIGDTSSFLAGVENPSVTKEQLGPSDGASAAATLPVDSAVAAVATQAAKKKKKKKSRASAVDAVAQEALPAFPVHNIALPLKETAPSRETQEDFFSETEQAALKRMFSRWHLHEGICFLQLWNLHLYNLFEELQGKAINSSFAAQFKNWRDVLLSKTETLLQLLLVYGEKASDQMAQVRERLQEVLDKFENIEKFTQSKSRVGSKFSAYIKENDPKESIEVHIKILIKIIDHGKEQILAESAKRFKDANLLNQGTLTSRLEGLVQFAEYCAYSPAFNTGVKTRTLKEARDQIKDLSLMIKTTFPRKKEKFAKKFEEIRRWFKRKVHEEFNRDVRSLDDKVHRAFVTPKVDKMTSLLDYVIFPAFFPLYHTEYQFIHAIRELLSKVCLHARLNVGSSTKLGVKGMETLEAEIREDHRALFLKYYLMLPHGEIDRHQVCSLHEKIDRKKACLLNIGEELTKEQRSFFSCFQVPEILVSLAEELKALQEKHEVRACQLMIEIGIRDKKEIKTVTDKIKNFCGGCAGHIVNLSSMLKIIACVLKYEETVPEMFQGSSFIFMPEIVDYLTLGKLEERLASALQVPADSIAEESEEIVDPEFDSNNEEEDKKQNEEISSRSSTALKSETRRKKGTKEESIDDLHYPSTGVTLHKESTKPEKSDRNKKWKVIQKLMRESFIMVEGARHIKVCRPEDSSVATLVSRSSRDSIPRGTRHSMNNGLKDKDDKED